MPRRVPLPWSPFGPASVASGTGSAEGVDTGRSRSRALWRCWICTATNELDELPDRASRRQRSLPSARCVFLVAAQPSGRYSLPRTGHQKTREVSSFAPLNPHLLARPSCRVCLPRSRIRAMPRRQISGPPGRAQRVTGATKEPSAPLLLRAYLLSLISGEHAVTGE
jgi:hypothetical protein